MLSQSRQSVLIPYVEGQPPLGHLVNVNGTVYQVVEPGRLNNHQINSNTIALLKWVGIAFLALIGLQIGKSLLTPAPVPSQPVIINNSLPQPEGKTCVLSIGC